jgi:hypothetical protein
MELLPLMQYMPTELIPVLGIVIITLSLYRAIAPMFKKPKPEDDDHNTPAVG